jgi:hypothetical protein
MLLTLAAEAREPEAFSLARTNLAAGKVMASQLAQKAMRSESRAE